MRAITEEVRIMPLAFMSARILAGSGLLAEALKSFIDASLQPATPSAAIRSPVRASFWYMDAGRLFLWRRGSFRAAAATERRPTLSPLTLKIPYRERRAARSRACH